MIDFRALLAGCMLALPAAAGPLEYLEAALANNLELQQAQAAAEAAAENIEVARAARRPQLRAGGSYRLDSKGMGDRLNGRVTGTQELLNLASAPAIEVAELRQERAELAVRSLEHNILNATYQAYLAASLAQRNIEVFERREASLREQLLSAEQLFSGARASSLQILNVEAQLASLEASRIEANNNLETALANLAHLAYVEAADVDALAGDALGVELLSLEKWLAKAEAAPDMRLAELDIVIQETEILRQENSLLPSLELEASLDQEADARLGLNFSAPLFSSGGASAALRGLERSKDGLQAAADALRRQKRLELSEALREFRQQDAVIAALRRRLAVENRRLQQAQSLFDLDSGLQADILDAQTALAESELQLASALHGQFRAYLRLLAASGDMTLAAAADLDALFE